MTLLVFIIALLFSADLWAAVTGDVYIVGYATAVLTFAQDITVSGGCADALVIGGASWKGDSGTTMSATAGTMTDSGAGEIVAPDAARFTQVFYRAVGSSAGTQTVTASIAAGADVVALQLSSWCNVNQATPVGTGAGNTDTYNTPLTINTTVAVDGAIVDQWSISPDSETFTAAGGQTEMLNDMDPYYSTLQILASYKTGCTGTCSMTWNYGTYGGYHAGVALPIRPTGGAPTATRRRAVIVIQ